MTFIPVPDVVEVAAEYLLINGNRAVNVLNFRSSALPINATVINDILDTYQSWENITAKAQRSNQVSLVKLSGRDLTSQNSFTVIREVSPAIVGAIASPAMPAQVTFSTSFRTGFAGRSFRGRGYWIGLAESQVTGDFVIAANAAAIRVAWETLNETMQALGSAEHTIVSRFSNGAPRTTGLATAVLEYVNVDTRVDTQRRRLIGEGS